MTLAITRHQGFHMTFKNGVTASVQFGPGHYCQHHDILHGADIVEVFEAPKKATNWESRDAEVAAWDKNGKWITEVLEPEHGDSVIGRLTADEVLEFLVKAAAFAPTEK